MFGFLFLIAMAIATVNAHPPCYICGGNANRKPTRTGYMAKFGSHPYMTCSGYDTYARNGNIEARDCYTAQIFVGRNCKCAAAADQEANMLDDAQDAAVQEADMLDDAQDAAYQADVLNALPDDFSFSFDKIEQPAEEPTYNPYVVGCLAFGTFFNFALLIAFSCHSRNNNRSPKL